VCADLYSEQAHIIVKVVAFREIENGVEDAVQPAFDVLFSIVACRSQQPLFEELLAGFVFRLQYAVREEQKTADARETDLPGIVNGSWDQSESRPFFAAFNAELEGTAYPRDDGAGMAGA
jgi:hypothetical protein